MKRLITLLVAIASVICVQAAYLKDVPMTLTQPDGTILHCFASGDEFFNYLHDKDGYTIIQHPKTGYYVYAEKRDGQLVATNYVAGKYDPASKGIQPYALISPEEWIARRKAWQAPERQHQNRDYVPNHGTLNNIAIFIRFSDDSEFTNTYSSIDNMFNDMSGGYGTSMRSYFQAASYGAIDIPTTFYPGHNGETIISYQDTKPRSYFQPYNASTNTNGYNGDNQRRTREFDLLQRAVNYINNNYPIPSNLNIDYDNDGLVDNVCFIVRGDVGAWSSLLWPHKWSLYDRTVKINSKRVYTFNFQLADATDDFNTSTMCHEMNHSLSAPDLYHYEEGYGGLHPVGTWDLMEYNMTPPQHCGAYMKMKYGHWIDEIPEITQAGTYTLNPISSANPINIAYKIATDDPNQYYVLEYRDNAQELAIPGSGLLIYRINTNFDGNQNYNPNNGIYDEVYLFRPGGTFSDDGNYYAAHFGSNVNRPEFSSSTDPYPFFSDGTIDNNFRIYDITCNGSIVTFKYGSSTCVPPTNLVAVASGKDVSLTWTAATNVQSYNIYRDGALIGNTDNTTYTDFNVSYGTHEYALRSIDVAGLSSALSEIVQVTIEPTPSNLTVTKNSDNAVLNWTEPEWCVPQTDNEVLTYGDGSKDYSFGYGDGETCLYIGHKYPTSMLSANKVLYKVSFYAAESGNFTLLVYTSTSGNSRPQTTLLEQAINVPYGGWTDVVISNPIAIDETKDLWVFIYDPEAHKYPFAIGAYEGNDNYGNYISYNPYNPTTRLGTQSGYVMLIRTCITDGAFTYNLYDGTTSVAQNLSGTSYTVSNIANNVAHRYTLKTNFDGGLTGASNMAGLTIGNASLSTLAMSANDKMTVTEGSKLTVSGTLSDVNADNLILEDGAQLFHNNSGVKATVHKNISAYGETLGWNFIASPMTSLTVNNSAHTNIASDDFDLYRFNQSPSPTTTNGKVEYLEWENWKREGSDHYHFDLEHGKGYLYAHNPDIDAVFMGELANPQNGDVEVMYSSGNPDSKMHGWSLIGNPFACNAYINRSYYKINDDSNGIQVVENNAAILPCTGIMVKTENTSGETVTFTKEPQTNEAKGSLNITLAKAGTRGNAIMDNAIITFNKDRELSKFFLPQNDANIYFPQNGEEYAIAYSQGLGEMPLNFIANTDGHYSIGISSKDVCFNYLHLVDNMTGADIDLLITPSYSFDARTTDYESRFKLVFISSSDFEGEDGDNDNFAFNSNGSWIISNNGEATVQLVDMAGQILNSKRINGSCNISFNVAPGLYILRLINGNSLQTQKIVIE